MKISAAFVKDKIQVESRTHSKKRGVTEKPESRETIN